MSRFCIFLFSVVLFLSAQKLSAQTLKTNESNIFYNTGQGDKITLLCRVFCPPNGVAGTYSVVCQSYINESYSSWPPHDFIQELAPSTTVTVVTTGGVSTFNDGSSIKTLFVGLRPYTLGPYMVGSPYNDDWIGESKTYFVEFGFDDPSHGYAWATNNTTNQQNVYLSTTFTVQCASIADDGGNGHMWDGRHPYTGSNVGTLELDLQIPVPPDQGTYPNSGGVTWTPTNTGSVTSTGNNSGGAGSSATTVTSSGSATVVNNNNSTVTNNNTTTVTGSGTSSGGSYSSSTANNYNSSSVVNNYYFTTNGSYNVYQGGTNSAASDEPITADAFSNTNGPPVLTNSDFPDTSFLLSQSGTNAATMESVGDAISTLVPPALVTRTSFGTMPDPVMNFWGHEQVIPISQWRTTTDKFRELILLVLLIWFYFQVLTAIRKFLASF